MAASSPWSGPTSKAAAAWRRFATEPLSYTCLGSTLIGGLATSTLLTLLVVPVFYTFFDDAQLARGRALRHALKGPQADRAEA